MRVIARLNSLPSDLIATESQLTDNDFRESSECIAYYACVRPKRLTLCPIHPTGRLTLIDLLPAIDGHQLMTNNTLIKKGTQFMNALMSCHKRSRFIILKPNQ